MSFVPNSRLTSANISSPQQTPMLVDISNPLTQQLPINANPSEILAARFSTWRAVIKGLIVYLRDVIAVHEESILQHTRLQNSLANNFPLNELSSSTTIMSNFGPNLHLIGGSNINSNSTNAGIGASNNNNNTPDEVNNIKRLFLPQGSGSIIDAASSLSDYHKTVGMYINRTSKELSTNIIPRLEDLRRDLSIKIKEIRNLSSDFKNTISKEVNQTKSDLSVFYSSIDSIKSISVNNLLPKQDPYLTKIYLDKQIKKQLVEENYLHEAFLNIQTSGKELEKLVVIEIQNALKVYARLMGEENQVIFNVLINNLDNGFITKMPDFEWNNFINANLNNFIDIDTVKTRKFSDISYKFINDPLTLEVRSSFLERRSKFLKSYSRGYYVLTPTFIHEFKSSDRKKDIYPIMSLSLDECQVAEHSKKDVNNPNTWHKFVLHTKQNGIIHRGHNWVFRAESYDLMIAWYNDIKKLTQLPTPEARAHYIAEKLLLQQQKLRNKSNRSSRNYTSSIIDNSSVINSDNLNTNANNSVVSSQGSINMGKRNLNNNPSKRTSVQTVLSSPINNNRNKNNQNDAASSMMMLLNASYPSIRNNEQMMRDLSNKSLTDSPTKYNSNNQDEIGLANMSIDNSDKNITNNNRFSESLLDNNGTTTLATTVTNNTSNVGDEYMMEGSGSDALGVSSGKHRKEQNFIVVGKNEELKQESHNDTGNAKNIMFDSNAAKFVQNNNSFQVS